jgi:hypothetical protein
VNKKEAHALLDKIRDGMPMAGATEALRLTGDIHTVLDESLCADGYESSHDRTSQIKDKRIEERFSYSQYLDCQTNKEVMQ